MAGAGEDGTSTSENTGKLLAYVSLTQPCCPFFKTRVVTLLTSYKWGI